MISGGGSSSMLRVGSGWLLGPDWSAQNFSECCLARLQLYWPPFHGSTPLQFLFHDHLPAEFGYLSLWTLLRKTLCQSAPVWWTLFPDPLSKNKTVSKSRKKFFHLKYDKMVNSYIINSCFCTQESLRPGPTFISQNHRKFWEIWFLCFHV